MTELTQSAKLPSCDKLVAVANPLNWDKTKNALMVEACREIAEFHYNNCPEIRAIYLTENFTPAQIKTEADLALIPSIGVQAMKYFLLTSLPPEQTALKLTSSGTRGQKTQIWFDAESLARVMLMQEKLWEQQKLISDVPSNYLAFIYDPTQAGELGISFSVKTLQRFAPVNSSYFTVQKNAANEWHFDIHATINKLEEYVAQNKPIRLHGIPAFIFDFVEHLTAQNLHYTLPKGSIMFTGGGWKVAEGRKVSKEEFRAKVSATLGIPEENILDGYGMAEHSAPYNECHHHKFHVPVWCRIIIRDPDTMRVLPPGETGLMELITPYNAMMPNLAILSTDLGFIEEKPCSCGYNSPTFVLVGRGGLSRHKGCAIQANELVKRKY